MTDRARTPHGDLLDRARIALGISQREAARRADISEGRWRQVVTGVQRQGGVSIPVNPKPSTLVAMARAVEADVDAVFDAAGLAAPDDRPATNTKAATMADLQQQVEELRDRLEEVARRQERFDERA